MLNVKILKKLAPYGDDIWLNWMVKLKGKKIRFSHIDQNLDGFGYEDIKIIRDGLYKKNVKLNFNDTQIKTFIKIILLSIVILTIYLVFDKSNSFNFRAILFNVISILTGTGYVNAQFDSWGGFPVILFLLLMFIGGCAGSTTCGVKIFRIQILFSFISNQLKKIIYPKGIFILKYDQNPVDNNFISSVISFIYLYLLIFFIITALLSLTGLDFVTSISGAATSISNVGPGLGSVIGPNGNFSSLPDISKWILTLGMILGRLELFAILVLFLPSFWRN